MEVLTKYFNIAEEKIILILRKIKSFIYGISKHQYLHPACLYIKIAARIIKQNRFQYKLQQNIALVREINY